LCRKVDSGAAIAGPHPLQVAADLPRAQCDAAFGEGSAELSAGPGPFPAQPLAQRRDGAAASLKIGGRSATEWAQGGGPAGEERAERIADGLRMASETGGDPGGGSSGVGERDHLDAVADFVW